jgi:tocopherol cyclase
MFYKIKKIWSPEIFQGHGKTNTYFEGWYYKLIDEKGNVAIAFIPGVFISENKERSHGFVQILDGHTGRSTYHPFPIDQFWASKKILEIRIGENIFRRDFIQLEIHSSEQQVNGQIRMSHLTSWPVTLTSPGIMGWYAFAPFMECYHGVVSLDHQLNGSLSIDGNQISFDGGRGYTEKDWGKSFPSSYIWLQANHFDKPGISLTASVANIPWIRGSFRGFIIGFLYKGILRRFTIYTKAAVKDVQISDNQASLVVYDKNYSMKIKAERNGGGLIHAPLRSNRLDEMEMQRRVSQCLTGKISIDFWEKNSKGEKLIYSGIGHHAAIEVHGNLSEILD